MSGSRAIASAALPHIMITGGAGHGKDSLCDHLVSCYGYQRMSFSDLIRDEVAFAYTSSPLPVTQAWLDDRAAKESPQARLALTHCADSVFVDIALRAFEREDRALFESNQQRSQSLPAARRLETLQHGLINAQGTGFTEQARLLLPRSPRRIQQLWGTDYRRDGNPLYWIDKAEQSVDYTVPQAMPSVRNPNELLLGERIGAVRIEVVRPGQPQVAAHVIDEPLPRDDRTIVLINDGTLSDLRAKADGVIAHLTAQPQPAPARSRALAP